MNCRAEAYLPDSNFLVHIQKDDTPGGLLHSKASDPGASTTTEPVAESKQPV